MKELTIKVHNDGKKRHQSFEAWADFEGMEIERGYGSTEEEAIQEFKDNFTRHWISLSSFCGSLLCGDPVVSRVNWKGEPLTKEDKQ